MEQPKTVLEVIQANRAARVAEEKQAAEAQAAKDAADQAAAEAQRQAEIAAEAQKIADAKLAELQAVKEEPAVEPPAEDKARAFKALGVDEHGVITLIGGASGSPDKLDLDGEFLEKGDLVKMGFDFCSNTSRTFKANHTEPIECDLVENWVGPLLIQDGKNIRALRANEKLTADTVVKGVGLRDESDAGAYWLVGVRPRDEAIIKAAREGKIAGASWGATCNKVEV